MCVCGDLYYNCKYGYFEKHAATNRIYVMGVCIGIEYFLETWKQQIYLLVYVWV